MDRTLVTGGAGFIGSALVRLLDHSGHEVHVLDDLSWGRRELAAVPDDRLARIDVRDRAAVADLIERLRPRWVVHLAAIHFIPYCNDHPTEAAEVNIAGTLNVLDAVRRSEEVQRVFFASTAAVYPIRDAATAEDVEPAPVDIYGLGKLVGERVCSELALATGKRVIAGRFFNAFGRDETNPHLIPEIHRQLSTGARTLRLGNLEPRRDFVHTEDLARGILGLLECEGEGFEVFNLGSGESHSVREVVTCFERALGEAIAIEVDPTRVRSVERMNLQADISRLHQRTGWQPRWTLETGIADLLAVDAPTMPHRD